MKPRNKATDTQSREDLAAGFAHHSAGRLGEAATCYKNVLKKDPDNAEALHLFGVLCLQQGNAPTAVDLIGKAVARDGRADWHNNFGEALRAVGRYEDAEASYHRAIALDPSNADAYSNLGAALEALGRPDAAEKNYARALAIDAGHAEARTNLGNLLLAGRRADDAIGHFRRALASAPGLVAAHCGLGNAFRQQGNHAEAEAAYRRALSIDPNDALSWSNLGIALNAQGRTPEALAAYERALAIAPDLAEAYVNIGTAYYEQGDMEKAWAATERALAINPELARAHVNKGLIHLVRGDYAWGWKEFRWRLRLPESRAGRFSAPLWDGGDLAGKTILLHAEQGIGDNIMMLRYVPLLAARGAKVVLDMPKAVRAVIGGLAGVSRVVADGEPLPPFDCHLPLMGLPGAFGTAFETVPANIPYLSVEEEKIERWNKRVGEKGFRVGIVWQGSKSYGADRMRSIPLRHFLPLADVPGVRLISLQQKIGLDQLAALPDARIESFDGVDATPFADTPAILMSLDLVVTADSSIGHLAGALGRPVWVALAHMPDWRWRLEGSDSPWYPETRLFRQGTAGDWPGVFAQIAAALPAMQARRKG